MVEVPVVGNERWGGLVKHGGWGMTRRLFARHRVVAIGCRSGRVLLFVFADELSWG